MTSPELYWQLRKCFFSVHINIFSHTEQHTNKKTLFKITCIVKGGLNWVLVSQTSLVPIYVGIIYIYIYIYIYINEASSERYVMSNQHNRSPLQLSFLLMFPNSKNKMKKPEKVQEPVGCFNCFIFDIDKSARQQSSCKMQ